MARSVTYIVVDDKQLAIDRITQMAQPFRNLILKQTFTDPAQALAYLEKNHVDFVLLDMEMPGIDGKAFMLQMPKEIKLVLYTAHDEYATDGFDFGVVDFLKKPVNIERFAKAVDRIKERLGIGAKGNGRIDGDYYYFMMKGPKKNMRTKINLDELVYIEAYNEKVYFHLAGEMAPKSKTPDGKGASIQKDKQPEGRAFAEHLKDLLVLLKDTQFMQIHRSIILNTNYLDEHKNQRVTLKGLDKVLPVGKRENYPEFFNLLERHNLPDNR